MKSDKPKKYLSETDKSFKRVSREYAIYKAKKHREALWLNENKEKVISTLPKLIAKNFASYDFSKFNKEEIKSVFISGGAGKGKTVYASYLYVNFIYDLMIERSYFNSITYNFVVFPDLINEMQKNISKNNSGLNYDLTDKYKNCDILVLDDVGVKKVSEFHYDLLYLIINNRYLEMKTTIITSNLNLSGLRELYDDDRIIRRIEEDYELTEF